MYKSKAYIVITYPGIYLVTTKHYIYIDWDSNMQVFVYVTNVPIVDIVKEVSHARTLSWRLNLSYF